MVNAHSIAATGKLFMASLASIFVSFFDSAFEFAPFFGQIEFIVRSIGKQSVRMLTFYKLIITGGGTKLDSLLYSTMPSYRERLFAHFTL